MEPLLRPRSVFETYGPIFLIALSLVGLGVGAWLLVAEPLTVGLLWLTMVPTAMAAVIIAARSRASATRERKLRAAVEADSLRLEEERSAWALRLAEEQRQLEAMQARLVDQAAAIAWSPRPPNAAPIPAEQLRRDEAVDRLIDATTERVFEALREGKYVRNERFEGRLFWEDIGTLVREVADIYQPGGDKAWLETDARQLALAVHRAALRVSLRLEQLPTAPSSRKLADIVKWTETYRSGQSLLEYAKPLMNYVPWLYRLVRVLAGANPATLGLSVILFELMKKAGFQISVEVLERYLKSLVHEFLTAVGQEAANVYGGAYGRRSSAWVLGAEAVHLARAAPQSRATLAAVIQLLDELELRDEVDRRALLRGLVAPTFAPVAADWLPIEERTAVLERIEALFEAQPPAMEPQAVAKWKAGLEQRLGHRSKLDADGGTVHDEAQRESIVRSLASWCWSRGAATATVRARLEDVRSLAVVEADKRAALLAEVVEGGPASDSPPIVPRFDLTEERKQAYVDDLLDLMAHLRPWGSEPDFAFLDEVARRFRLDSAKIRGQLGARYVQAFADTLAPNSPLKKLPPGTAFAALTTLHGDEDWDFAEDARRIVAAVDTSKEDKKTARDFQRELSRGASLSLLVSPQRTILLRKVEVQNLAPGSVVWEGQFTDPSVRVEQAKHHLGWRTATIYGGRWTPSSDGPPGHMLGLEVSRACGDRILQGIEAGPARPAP